MSLFSAKQTVTLDVKGMHCEKCVAHVTEALEGVEGVTSADVSLEGESAVVEGRGFEVDALIAAVEEAGFQASPVAYKALLITFQHACPAFTRPILSS